MCLAVGETRERPVLSAQALLAGLYGLMPYEVYQWLNGIFGRHLAWQEVLGFRLLL